MQKVISLILLIALVSA